MVVRDKHHSRSPDCTIEHQPLEIFDPFPDLPAEVRLLIWKYALSTPRVVGVKIAHSSTGRMLVPTNPLSPLLRVNKEARTEALKVIQPYRRDNKTQLHVYANFDLDIIWFVDNYPLIIFGERQSIIMLEVESMCETLHYFITHGHVFIIIYAMMMMRMWIATAVFS